MIQGRPGTFVPWPVSFMCLPGQKASSASPARPPLCWNPFWAALGITPSWKGEDRSAACIDRKEGPVPAGDPSQNAFPGPGLWKHRVEQEAGSGRGVSRVGVRRPGSLCWSGHSVNPSPLSPPSPCLPGPDVPLCPGLQGWLGEYHVQWTGCCRCGPAGGRGRAGSQGSREGMQWFWDPVV